MSDNTIYILESYKNFYLGELHDLDPKWNLPQYVVKYGKHQKIFRGETAYSDAQRLYYDTVLPLIHGKSY